MTDRFYFGISMPMVRVNKSVMTANMVRAAIAHAAVPTITPVSVIVPIVSQQEVRDTDQFR